MDGVNLAYRYWQIVPKKVTASGEWPQHNTNDPPKPPHEWRPQSQGFRRPWHTWRSSKPLLDDQVEPRKAFSVLWCQRTQTYWVVDYDCTDPREESRAHSWQQLQCQNLGTDVARPRDGLWRLVEHGTLLQHDSECPPNFDEFLPKNFFKNQNTNPCHFFGNFGLIFALLAMCPENPNDIPRQIDDVFYIGESPCYVPCVEHKLWQPMSKYYTPGRALVMQTGLVKSDGGASERIIRDFESGLRGSMVSSHQPTPTELASWGLPKELIISGLGDNMRNFVV